MANTTIYRGRDMAFTIEDSEATTFLQDFVPADITSANKGFFWKVTSISFTPTQNTSDRPHVGTDEVDVVNTTKTFEATVEIDLFTADGDVTLSGTSGTWHAIDPKSIIKQVIEGDGELYEGKLYIGCSQKANAANGEEDHADPDTADYTINLHDIQFLTAPLNISPNDTSSTSFSIRLKSADIA